MRLTLRTLLAYLDGMLEPQEAKQLGDRIAESPLARRLIERIQAGLDSVESSSDGSTKPLMLDPNALAEYLDNVLAVEQVPELERLCIDHQSALIEVASCHHTLSTALNSTVETDQELRLRLHQLIHKVDREGRGSVSNSDASQSVGIKAEPPHGVEDRDRAPTISSTSSDRDEADALSGIQPSARSSSSASEIDLMESSDRFSVPRYLREDQRSDWRSALWNGTLVALVLILFWQAIGSLDRVRTLWSTPSVTRSSEPNQRSLKEQSSQQLAMETRGQGGARPPQAAASNQKVLDRPKNQATSQPDGNSSESPSPELVQSPTEIAVDPNSQWKGETSEASQETLSEASMPSEPSEESSANTTDATADASRTASDLLDRPTTTPTVAQSSGLPPGVPIAGTWLPQDAESAKALVFAWENSNGEQPAAIHRLTPGIGMKLRTRVLVPALQRTHFSLFPGGRWEAVGISEWEFLQALPIHRIRIDRGRFIISSSPDMKSIELHCAGKAVRLEWHDVAGTCSVQADPFLNPEATELRSMVVYIQPLDAPMQWSVHSLDNESQVTEDGPKTLGVGEYLRLASWEAPTVFAAAQAPGWIAGVEERQIDIAGATELQQLMKVGTESSPTSELAELLTYRRQETAAMAMRSLIALGRFEALFGSKGFLSKDAMRAHWENLVTDLKGTLAVYPERWISLRQVLASEYGESAERVERLILGPTRDQLRQGADRELVELLNSNQLEIRVLAFHALKTITGRDFGFLPERPTPQSLGAWEKLLSEGGIRTE